MKSELAEGFPPANKQLTTQLSTPEARFLQIEHLTGKFDSQSAAARFYIRKGLEAEGLLKDALNCF